MFLTAIVKEIDNVRLIANTPNESSIEGIS